MNTFSSTRFLYAGFILLILSLTSATLYGEAKAVSKREVTNHLGRITHAIDNMKGESPKYWVQASELPFYSSPDNRTGAKILIDRERVGPTLVSLQKLTLFPGGKLTRTRFDSALVIFVIDGELTFKLGSFKKVTLKKDGSVLIPPQSFIEIENTGKSITRILRFFSPAGPEQTIKKTWKKAFKEKN